MAPDNKTKKPRKKLSAEEWAERQKAYAAFFKPHFFAPEKPLTQTYKLPNQHVR